MRAGWAMVVVGALGAGCAASISLPEHQAALAEDRKAYEARLLVAERRVAEAARAEARCRQERAQDRAAAEARASRLESALSDKEARLRTRGGPRGGRGEDARRAPGPPEGLAPWLAAHDEARHRVVDGVSVVTLGADALFVVGAARLTDTGRAALRTLAGAIPGAARIELRVHGAPLPPDGVGPWTDVWQFTAARAAALSAALQDLGVDPSRLLATAGGARQPEGGDAAADRVEIRLGQP